MIQVLHTLRIALRRRITAAEADELCRLSSQLPPTLRLKFVENEYPLSFLVSDVFALAGIARERPLEVIDFHFGWRPVDLADAHQWMQAPAELGFILELSLPSKPLPVHYQERLQNIVDLLHPDCRVSFRMGDSFFEDLSHAQIQDLAEKASAGLDYSDLPRESSIPRDVLPVSFPPGSYLRCGSPIDVVLADGVAVAYRSPNSPPPCELRSPMALDPPAPAESQFDLITADPQLAEVVACVNSVRASKEPFRKIAPVLSQFLLLLAEVQEQIPQHSSPIHVVKDPLGLTMDEKPSILRLMKGFYAISNAAISARDGANVSIAYVAVWTKNPTGQPQDTWASLPLHGVLFTVIHAAADDAPGKTLLVSDPNIKRTDLPAGKLDELKEVLSESRIVELIKHLDKKHKFRTIFVDESLSVARGVSYASAMELMVRYVVQGFTVDRVDGNVASVDGFAKIYSRGA